MKNLITLLILVLLGLSCNSPKENEYLIEGSLRGDLADNTEVFLRKSDANLQPVEGDTTIISKGTFTFSGRSEEPQLYYLFIEGAKGGIPLILEDGTVQITAHVDSLNAAVVTGTMQNKAYGEFLEGSRQLAGRANSIKQEMQQAVVAQDTANMTALRDEFFELQDEGMEYEKDFVKSHADALISALLVNRMLQTKAHPVPEIQELFEGLSEGIRNTTIGSGISEKLEVEKRIAIGSKAPDFSAPTPSGEALSLNQVLGKVTLVDFWAAWCRPCRAENPNIVKVYEQYKGKGLTILGVSLDRNAEDWKKAIADDGLIWNHVSNVRYFDEIAKLYNVSAIPASFILDENGVIVAKNLRGAALEAKIAELLP